MQEQSVRNQYIAAFVANLLTMGFGVFEGWTSPSILLLTSDETPLPSGKISNEEASWVASLQCVGCFFGNFLFGYITNRFGRKVPLIIISFPIIISWFLTWFAQNIYYLYGARLLGGFFSGGGGYMIVPLFLSEIASDRVRGILGSTLVLTENVGMLLAFAIGNYFPLYAIAMFSIVLIAIFAVSLCFLPESPLVLVRQNRIAEAENSIQFYQNIHKTDSGRKLIELEIAKLKGSLEMMMEQSTEYSENAFDWHDFTTRIARKAILIGIVIVAMNQFTGVVAILSYTATIFEEAGSNMSPNTSAMVIGVIQVFGNIIASNLVDRSGRKLLLTISNIGAALGLVVLAAYMMLKSWNYEVETFNWIPVASLSFVIFVASLGILSLPFIVIPEIMPEKIKDTSVSFCMGLLWTFSFITIKYLPSLIETISFHGSMYLFAGVCMMSAIFIIFVVPETKGKSREQIMQLL